MNNNCEPHEAHADLAKLQDERDSALARERIAKMIARRCQDERDSARAERNCARTELERARSMGTYFLEQIELLRAEVEMLRMGGREE